VELQELLTVKLSHETQSCSMKVTQGSIITCLCE